MKRTTTALIAGLLLALPGCATVFQSAFDSAGQRIGTSIGNALGDAIVRNYTASVRAFYTSYLVELAFHSAGQHAAFPIQRTYAEGEYTRWQVLHESGSEDSWMERVYLGLHPSGNHWWQITFYDGASMDTIMLQGLFEPETEELVRLRGQFPGDSGPSEIPVDRNRQRIRHEPLSQVSLAEATRDRRRETVAAGTFMIREVVIEDEAEGALIWWLTDQVPGEVVRYAHIGEPEAQPRGTRDFDASQYVVELQRYGGGQQSALGHW